MSRLSQLVTDLVDFGAAMDVDEALNHDELRQRDALIAQRLPKSDKLARIRGWLNERRAQQSSVFETADRIDGPATARAVQIVGTLLAFAGLLFGWGAALALFRYDGTSPVNVVHILGFFVVLQLVLLLGFFLLTLPPLVAQRVPLLSGLQSILRGFSPGYFLPLISRALPQHYRNALNSLTQDVTRGRHLYGRALSWTALEWSQRFALAFQFGALMGALTLTVFSDLAFGWSTTLDVAAEGFHRVTRWLSLPWAWWLPQAAPDLELVKQTQFFRLQSSQLTTPDAASIRARWWPFVLMCLLTYAVLPRLLTWWWARTRQVRSLQQTLLSYPGVHELMARLKKQRVETQAVERTETVAPMPATTVTETLTDTLDGHAIVIDWSDAAGSETLASQLTQSALGIQTRSYIQVGGNRSIDDDQQSLAGISFSDDAPMVFIVRAWETPTLDILDTLGELRQQMTPNTTLCVLILENADSRARGDFDVWKQTLARLSDPWLRTLSVDLDSESGRRAS